MCQPTSQIGWGQAISMQPPPPELPPLPLMPELPPPPLMPELPPLPLVPELPLLPASPPLPGSLPLPPAPSELNDEPPQPATTNAKTSCHPRRRPSSSMVPP
jgi:hypothetical protein